MYLIKSPRLLKWYYPELTWHMERTDKVIYLTFDDGPIPDVTPFVLKTLRMFEAKATFFCIGDNVRKYPEIFSALKDEGHSIGNHTFNHLKGWKTHDKIYLENFELCQEITGTELFRPPYGRIRKSQIAEIKRRYPNLKVVMWDVLSGDFDLQLSPVKCLNNVLTHTENGSIVVFHDSQKAFDRLKYALPKTLEHFAAQGYTFRAL
ncbi:polysaccharide deacetylase family protein [Pedobacter faecalis]|uniref:polysaccharide deacetylase family protein n=1 Tax=Pedobacter faecalis TaxID=3041495 RepID=UPI00254F4D2E|nr:polysaccharide deacetylase family protein [Pedobacter sp. ELA7]